MLSRLDRTKIEYTTQGSIPITISIERWQDGGGTNLCNQIKETLKTKYKNRIFKNCLEWCSGPGMIAYDLYSHKIVENLSLLDMNGEVLKTARQIAKDNNISDKVKTYVATSPNFLPANEKFDLIVGNPPFYKNLNNDKKIVNNFVNRWDDNQRRIGEDKDWATHIDFFKCIKNYLSDDGLIILVEAKEASTVDTFKPMIDQGGLKIIDSYPSYDNLGIYAIEITHNEKL